MQVLILAVGNYAADENFLGMEQLTKFLAMGHMMSKLLDMEYIKILAVGHVITKFLVIERSITELVPVECMIMKFVCCATQNHRKYCCGTHNHRIAYCGTHSRRVPCYGIEVSSLWYIRTKNFLFWNTQKNGLYQSVGPTQPIRWEPQVLPLGVERPGHQVDHSTAHSADVNEWIYSCTSPHAFIACTRDFTMPLFSITSA